MKESKNGDMLIGLNWTEFKWCSWIELNLKYAGETYGLAGGLVSDTGKQAHPIKTFSHMILFRVKQAHLINKDIDNRFSRINHYLQNMSTGIYMFESQKNGMYAKQQHPTYYYCSLLLSYPFIL